MLDKISANKIENKEMQNKLNLVLHRYFGVFIFILVIVLLYFGYARIIAPQNESLTIDSGAAIADKQTDKRMLEGVLNKLTAYHLAYEAISPADKEKLNKILPEMEGAENLFTNWEAFIIRQGLILDGIEIKDKSAANANPRQRQTAGEGGAVAPSGVESIGLSMNISGINSYEGLKKFLIAAEKHMRLLDLANNSYSEGGTLALEAQIYYLK